MFYRIALAITIALTALSIARADSTGTTYVHKGREVSKFEALKILLASNNKETILKCSEQYMDERRGTLKNK
jgi:hypothetical protein